MIGFGSQRITGTTIVKGQADMPKAGTIGFGASYPNSTSIVTEESE